MKAVAVLSSLLLFAIVGCKTDKDGGLPSFSAGIYSQKKEEINKKFKDKFAAAKKQMLNKKLFAETLYNSSPFRTEMHTNQLGAMYAAGDANGKDFLLKTVLKQHDESFCAMTPTKKAQRLIEVSVDIQNSIHLLEVAMRMEDYSHIMQHAEALNDIPLDVIKQIMNDLMTNPNSIYLPQNQKNADNAKNPNADALDKLIKEFKGKTSYNDLTPEGKKIIDKFDAILKENGQNIDKNRLIGLYYESQFVALGGLGAGQGEQTKLNAMISGRLVLPAGAKAPLQVIAKKYRRLLILRSEASKNPAEESIRQVRLSKNNLEVAEDDYNDPDLNNQVREALKELSKIFPKSKFLKKGDHVFLNKLTLNKTRTGWKGDPISLKEEARILKKRPKEMKKYEKASNEDKAALERMMAYAAIEEEADVSYDELGDLDSLEQLMGSLLADSANFASVNTARMFLANDPYAIDMHLNAAIEDAGWPNFSRKGQPGYRFMDSFLADLGGQKTAIVSPEAIYEALKNNIDHLNLGDKKQAVADALKYFDSIGKVKAYRDDSIFRMHRDKILAAEGQLRLSDSFTTQFSPFREWKGIMCQAIKSKGDCNILDLYMDVANQPEQSRELLNQIKMLLGLKENSSLKDRYFSLLKALRDIVDITDNINVVCPLGERLDGVQTVGITDFYFYTKVKSKDVWDANITFKKEIDDTLGVVKAKSSGQTDTTNAGEAKAVNK